MPIVELLPVIANPIYSPTLIVYFVFGQTNESGCYSTNGWKTGSYLRVCGNSPTVSHVCVYFCCVSFNCLLFLCQINEPDLMYYKWLGKLVVLCGLLIVLGQSRGICCFYLRKYSNNIYFTCCRMFTFEVTMHLVVVMLVSTA